MLTLLIAWRLILFVIAWLARHVLEYKPSFPYAQSLAESGLPTWIYSWANFDGVHYITIVKNGYVGTGLIQAFFPLYPLLSRLVTMTGMSPLVSGLLVSHIALIGFILCFYEYVAIRFSQQIALWSILAVLIFPTSFFLGAVYSESIFLFLVAATFLAAEKKRWWLAAIFAGLAGATRVVGIALLPYLLLEVWRQARSRGDLSRQYLFQHLPKLAFATMGLVAYMLYLQLEFADPLYFLHVQSEFGGGRQESLVLYPQVIWRYLKILFTTQADWIRTLSFGQEFLAGICSVGSALIFYRKLRQSELVFVLLVCLIPPLTGTFSSMSRYMLAALPLFILLGQYLQPRKVAKILYLTATSFLLIMNTILFIQGYWVA